MDTSERKTYWEDRLTRQFTLQGVGYIGLSDAFNVWLYRVKRHAFHRAARATGVDVARAEVLDIGSGTGFLIDRWLEAGCLNLTGIDLTQISVASLSEKYPGCRFHQVDIGESAGPLEGRQFDLISSFDVLYHIVDDASFERAILNISGLLKPGGYFLISDNFLHGETIRGDTQTNRSLDYMTGVFSDAGLEILSRRPQFYLLNNPIDSENPFLRFSWRVTAKLASMGNLPGFLIGALLYPIELFCISTLTESPTTEVALCRKREA